MDMVAFLLTLLGVGLGAYMSTFPTEVIRGFGLLLIGASVTGLIIWSIYEYGMPKMGPSILALIGIVFLIGAFAWHVQLSQSQLNPPRTATAHEGPLAPEVARVRLGILHELSAQYAQDHGGKVPKIADKAFLAWLNMQLIRRGETWQVNGPSTYPRPPAAFAIMGNFKGAQFKNVTISGTEGAIFVGGDAENLTFDDVKINAPGTTSERK
jgi:hypothetical protein